MPTYTREIYTVPQNGGKSEYAGYAVFNEEGFVRTAGGYGRNPSGNKREGRVRNTINTVSARIAKKTPKILR